MEHIKEIIKTALPDNERMNLLLNDLSSKKITMQEFDKECAYWFIIYEDLKPLSLPSRIQKMLNYDILTPFKKQQIPDSFWRQWDVLNYIETKQNIIHRNRCMYQDLIKFKDYIPKEDMSTIEKFDIFITQYISFFNGLSKLDRQKMKWELYKGEFN